MDAFMALCSVIYPHIPAWATDILVLPDNFVQENFLLVDEAGYSV
ncbi:hypothetical protein Hamer_G024662 [Homarus americanus]|uniref:Uncharacterized protein n=1 Tax=Homarus americanus TaxID=6706 RepID=A0A8J5JWI3_HOMAM|nr:hypothetical protein Hamer_G024662 [Homarus americanus]